MKNLMIYHLLTYIIASVWMVNGLICKVLNQVPRHETIVAAILGDRYASVWTVLIGLAEIMMALWIVSGYQSRLNAITQMAVVATMNVLEFLLVPDLLLWGKLNAFFAFLFILVIYFREFYLNRINTD